MSGLFLLVLVVFLVIFVIILELLDVAIPDIPLSDFASQIVSDRWTSGCPSFLDRSVDCLDLPVLVVKFIFHGLLDGFNIFS